MTKFCCFHLWDSGLVYTPNYFKALIRYRSNYVQLNPCVDNSYTSVTIQFLELP